MCWLDQNSQQGEAFWVEEEKGWARSGRPGRQSGAGARAQGSESRSRTQGQTSGSLSYVSSPKAELSGQPGRPQSERLGQLQRNLVKGTRRVGRAPGEGLGLRGSFSGPGGHFFLSTDAENRCSATNDSPPTRDLSQWPAPRMRSPSDPPANDPLLMASNYSYNQ